MLPDYKSCDGNGFGCYDNTMEVVIISQLNEKIRILLHNREWTQAELAKKLNVAPTTVQKWVSGKNTPTIQTLKELCSLFSVSYKYMLDDGSEIPKYIEVGTVDPRVRFFEQRDDSLHILVDASLKRNALLHRFKNATGDDCSAIYIGRIEQWWTYREDEARMIKDWNELFV